jgi:hypothetical protein
LKDVDWKIWTKTIEKYFKQEPKLKEEQPISNYKTANVEHSSEKLKNKEKLVLYKNCEEMMKNQKEICNQIKIAHFEMRRLIMLINLHKYLSTLQHLHKDLKSDNVRHSLSKFCYLTSTDLKAKISQNLPSHS